MWRLCSALVALAVIGGAPAAKAYGEGPVRFSAVGDSLTAACELQLTAAQSCSWTGWVDAERDLVFAGGWAVWGARSDQAAASAPPLRGDLVIAMLGTNDIAQSVPVETQFAALHDLTAGGTGAVLLLAIPPVASFYGTGAVETRNGELEAFAEDQGWAFLDPWVRTQDGRWPDGASYDGVHPTDAVQQEVGEIVADHILDSGLGR